MERETLYKIGNFQIFLVLTLNLDLTKPKNSFSTKFEASVKWHARTVRRETWDFENREIQPGSMCLTKIHRNWGFHISPIPLYSTNLCETLYCVRYKGSCQSHHFWNLPLVDGIWKGEVLGSNSSSPLHPLEWRDT